MEKVNVGYIKVERDAQGYIVDATLSKDNQGILVIYHWIEQNAMFDPERSNNGGGYHQPLWHIYVPELSAKIVLSDLSCGDFGTRYDADVSINNNVVAEAYWGSMEDQSSEYSSFSGDHDVFVAIMYAITGVQPPWDYELDDKEEEL